MSENYSLKELNEWADKVIDCISKWADEMNKAFNGTPASIKIEKLDFSERNKVFEDRIADLENIINHKLGDWNKHGITYQEIMDMKAENQELKQITKGYEDKIVELKKDYRTVSELLGKYQQENESLKKRIIELENFSCQAEQETESLVEKLNQRIVKLEKSRSEWIDKTVEWQQKCEKLESKETEKTTKYTTVIVAKEINGQTYVTLDDFTFVVNALQAQIGT